MEYRLIAPNDNIVRVVTDNATATNELLKILWDKFIVKSNEYVRIDYKYNYSNKQTMTIKQRNGYCHKFDNIPVSLGYLDASMLTEMNRQAKLELVETLKGGE